MCGSPFLRSLVLSGNLKDGSHEGICLLLFFSVCSFHLPQDFALVHGENAAIVPHFLEHGSALKLVARLLEVVPVQRREECYGLGMCDQHTLETSFFKIRSQREYQQGGLEMSYGQEARGRQPWVER